MKSLTVTTALENLQKGPPLILLSTPATDSQTKLHAKLKYKTLQYYLELTVIMIHAHNYNMNARCLLGIDC